MYSCKGRQEKKRMVFTIALIRNKEGKILLLYKKIGKFGVGKWNGPGGEVEAGETVEKAGAREVLEETSSTKDAKDGIVVKRMVRIGYLEFEFLSEPGVIRSEPGVIRECHVILVKEYEGEAKENVQMSPDWFFENEIPFVQMWRADEKWFQFALVEIKFWGWFLYDNPEDGNILDFKIEEV